MMRKLIKNRCPNRLERKKEILQKVLFFRRKTIHFEDPRVQNPIKNRSEIQARKSDAKMMRKLSKIASKLISNLAKNRSKNDAKNRSKKSRKLIRKIGGTSGPKSKKIGNLSPESHPRGLPGVMRGSRWGFGAWQDRELWFSTPVPRKGAADLIAYVHSAGPRFLGKWFVGLWGCGLWFVGLLFCWLAGLWFRFLLKEALKNWCLNSAQNRGINHWKIMKNPSEMV